MIRNIIMDNHFNCTSDCILVIDSVDSNSDSILLIGILHPSFYYFQDYLLLTTSSTGSRTDFLILRVN